MRKKILLYAVAWVCAVALAGPCQAAKTGGDATPAIEEKAMSILTGVAEILSRADRFTVTMRDAYDIVQDSGQKIEFGDVLKITLKRPDQMRVEITENDGDTGIIVFDGKTISVSSAKEKTYASASQPGGLDDAVPYFVSALGMRFPLARLFVSTLPEYLKENLISLQYVEATNLMGVLCDHIAGRLETTDFQLWATQGDRPMLQRVVITYKKEPGEPQFESVFSDWNFSPQISDAAFAFKAPEGFELIQFVTEMPESAVVAKPKKGGKK